MTTTTVSAFEVIKERLPSNVIYQFAPLDIPYSMDVFLQYWRPNAVMLMESELWPNLIMGAARNGVSIYSRVKNRNYKFVLACLQIALALLNGRISTKSFRNWSNPVILPLIKLMLSKFSLILPLSTIQGIQFQLLQAPPYVINYTGDLKFAISDYGNSVGVKKSLEEIQAQLSCRKVWMASSIHKGEDEVFIRAHKLLKQKHPDLVTIIVPRKPHLGQDITLRSQEEGISVALRSRGDNLTNETGIYMVDTLGELRDFYSLTPIAVVGASFLPGSAGHNISEAAGAGCAVLTGHHVGHFSHMVAEMQHVNPLSVLQVSHEKLVDVVSELFVNAEILEARRLAARQAYLTLSRGIVEKLWDTLHFHIFMKSVSTDDAHGERG
ncbi:probable 3-deoxy-D-manno-octulosonic acid transferase, mitochondrial [Salvia hispanica]|uniref:probable 3-deoxy-D-manno-octulosonic acid transferase, mitochondrial n=1 Tax=Salvia hispanica TaxID=49212 RepID=UPI0020091CD8|nr:probable 3-deoxy-D-manno-octulosonic acid transferase, mitochondrial [Salvia hispanica]